MAGKQKELPGVEREKIQEIEDAAAEYVKVRDKRMELTEQEVEAKDALLAAMKEHRLKKYRTDDDRIVTIEPKENVKVRKDEPKETSIQE